MEKTKELWNQKWMEFVIDNEDVGNDLVELFKRAIKHFDKNDLKLLKQASDANYDNWIDWLFKYFEEDEMDKAIEEYAEAMDLLEGYLDD